MSTSEQLTQSFYEWELRGRGWYLYNEPIEIEPPFVPFYGHYISKEYEIEDDTAKQTLLSSVTNFFKKTPKTVPENVKEILPHIYTGTANHIALGVVLPQGEKIALEEITGLLLMLSYTKHPVSFEIVGTEESIQIQFVCVEEDKPHVIAQIQAHFPHATTTEKGLTGLNILQEHIHTTYIDLGLANEFMCALSMPKNLDIDPYIGLYAVLEQLSQNERGIVQILFNGTRHPWSESIMRSVSDNKGGSFFADVPDMPKYAKEKIAHPLYSVCIKVIGQSNTQHGADTICKGIAQALLKTSQSHVNTLIPLSLEGMDGITMYDGVLLRQSHRLGMLLNSNELATLLHFPTDSIHSKKVEREVTKSKQAPSDVIGHTYTLGINTHKRKETIVSLSNKHRLRHTHIIGATGTGKSTLLLNLINNDLRNGEGIGVIDPHGDLIDTILTHIPEERINDVILIDPSDSEYPVGLNIIHAHSDIEKEQLSSDLVSVFKRLSTSWGDQMNSVLANAVLALLESTEISTLADLRRFLVEPQFRKQFLLTVSDNTIQEYWQHTYPLLKSSSLGSILTRLDAFLRPKLIRNMVIQKKSIDFEDVLNTKKIVLVKLSQGLIGVENSYLLGTLIVSKLYQAALARQGQKEEHRTNFFLYVDEFQNFITPSMSAILSGARKYHLGLILAHQDMAQLQKYDTELASSVIANPSTRICFRLGDIDAKKFESSFEDFEAKDLQKLKIGQAIVRVERSDYDFNLLINPLTSRELELQEDLAQRVISASRERYSTNKADIDSSITTRQETKPAKPVTIEKIKSKQQEPIEKHIPQVLSNPKEKKPKQESKHRHLQMLIKRMAEQRGYKASIEEVTKDEKGKVDVALVRGKQHIAIEVSITTNEEWELHNVEKCLSSGYDTVIVCSDDEQHLKKIQTFINKHLNKELLKNIHTYTPHDLFTFLDKQVANEQSSSKVVKGYTVKVEYDVISHDEIKKKHTDVIAAIAGMIQKRK